MSETPSQGSVLGGRYRLEELIGSGGMASVWAAVDVELDRPVAVKVISETLAQDDAFMGRFRHEARIAAAFAHRNVVRVYDFNEEDGRPFLVMERVDGGTLADRLQSGTPDIEPGELTSQLLAALEHIHEAGVVHRDVKPANVLFDKSGNALLTDFGIAHSKEATRYTQTGSVIGTLMYMAPELRRGDDPSPRSDLYSLGVLLGELGPLPPALARLAESMTADEPGLRPASAAAARAELEGAEVSPTAPTAVLATGPTAPLHQGAGPAAGATWWKWALGLVAVLALAVVLALAAGLGDDEESPGSKGPSAAKTTTVTEPQTKSTTEEAPAPAPAPETEPGPAEEASDCDQLEEEKKQLEEERKATEAELKDDKEAKEAAKQQFEDEKHALDEQIKACKEAEKA